MALSRRLRRPSNRQDVTNGARFFPLPAVFLGIATLNGLVLCQYVPCKDPASCANHGQLRPYYAQVRVRRLLKIKTLLSWRHWLSYNCKRNRQFRCPSTHKKDRA